MDDNHYQLIRLLIRTIRFRAACMQKLIFSIFMNQIRQIQNDQKRESDYQVKLKRDIFVSKLMRKEYTLNFEKNTSKTARTTAKKKHCQHKSDKIIRTEDQENKKAPEVEHLIEDN